MISPAIDTIVLAFFVTFLLEFAVRLSASGPKALKKSGPKGVFAVGVLVTLTIMVGIGDGVYTPMNKADPSILYWVIGGILVVYTAGLRSDFLRKHSTRRHTIATVAAALLLFVGGLRISFVGIPGLPTLVTGLLIGLVLTILWVFLIVSVIEIGALIPFLAGGAALLMGAATLVFDANHPTWPGHVITGTLMGAILGRGMPELFFAYSRPPEKSEVLVLGFLTACSTLAVYTKTFALTGMVFPVGAAAVIAVLLFTQSMDRSLMLRPTPRG